jgi:hypothetical protein
VFFYRTFSGKNGATIFLHTKRRAIERLPFNTLQAFKTFLKLRRDDKVPINLIPMIEAKLKTFQNNVRGDYIYTSPIQSKKIINYC